jgi:hypothetical protein
MKELAVGGGGWLLRESDSCVTLDSTFLSAWGVVVEVLYINGWLRTRQWG